MATGIPSVPTVLTPTQDLEQIKTVDGTGSGLDADLVRGSAPMAAAPAATSFGGVPQYGQYFPTGRPARTVLLSTLAGP